MKRHISHHAATILPRLPALWVCAAILLQSLSEAEAQQNRGSTKVNYRESTADTTLGGGVGGGGGGRVVLTSGGWGAGGREYADTFDATVNSGTIEIEFRPYLIPDSLNVYYPPRKSNGKSIADTGGPVSTLTLKNPIITPFKNWPTSLFEIVVNEGSKVDSITIWDYVVTVKDDDGKVVKTYTSSATTSAGLTNSTPTPRPQYKPVGITRVNLRVPSARTLAGSSSGVSTTLRAPTITTTNTSTTITTSMTNGPSTVMTATNAAPQDGNRR